MKKINYPGWIPLQYTNVLDLFILFTFALPEPKINEEKKTKCHEKLSWKIEYPTENVIKNCHEIIIGQ